MGLIVLLIELFHKMWKSRPLIDMPLFVIDIHNMNMNNILKYIIIVFKSIGHVK